jgi:hypothetical protein
VIAGAWVNQALYQAMWQRMACRMDLGVNDSRTFRADADGEGRAAGELRPFAS